MLCSSVRRNNNYLQHFWDLKLHQSPKLHYFRHKLKCPGFPVCNASQAIFGTCITFYAYAKKHAKTYWYVMSKLYINDKTSNGKQCSTNILPPRPSWGPNKTSACPLKYYILMFWSKIAYRFLQDIFYSDV